MNGIKVLDSFEVGWKYACKHGIVLSIVLLVIYVLIYNLFMMCFPEEFWKVYEKVIKTGDIAGGVVKMAPYIESAMTKIWLVSIMQFCLMAGVMNVAKAKYDGITSHANLKYLSLPLMSYVKVVGVFCMLMLVWTLSLYLYGLPMIYLGTRMLFMLPAILENPDLPLGMALRNSWNMTYGRFWKLLGFECLCILVIVVGMLCFFVGIFFASVICIYALMDIYKQSKG